MPLPHAPWLTITEAAEAASCHPDTLYAAIASGTLRAQRDGEAGPYRIAASALHQWEAERLGASANAGTGALAVKGSIRRAARRTDPDDASLSPALLAGVLGMLLEDDGRP